MINCDMGEGLIPSPDKKIMPLIDMASIACGGHAGDSDSINQTIKLAIRNQIIIGAHPGYADKKNFGRSQQNISNDEMRKLVSSQIKLFCQICANNNTKASYIKPHGALYHQMMIEEQTLEALCQILNKFNIKQLVVQHGINTKKINNICSSYKIKPLFEAFADRKYNGKTLVSRKEEGAVFSNKEQIIAQYKMFMKNSVINTVCFHSDNPASIMALEALKE